MKYKIATFLLLGITIILCFGYLHQKQEISKLNAQSKVIGKTDTIYLNKPYKPVKEYGTQLLPRYVFLYGNTWTDKKERDNIADTISNQVSKEDSLVQMLLSKEDLSLSFFRPSTESFFTEKFNLDLENFSYNWVNGNLTQKKVGFKLKLEPYVYAKYRYFNRMADAGIGISFKTRNLHYKLGLNGFYYPCLQDKLGTDLEFSITYNLSK